MAIKLMEWICEKVSHSFGHGERDSVVEKDTGWDGYMGIE